jgi:hypothetical protein
MKMIALLEKLETDAVKASRKQAEEDRLFAVQLKASPEAKLADKRNELRRLQAHTNAMKNELAIKRQLEAEYNRSAELTLELKEANMTLDERQERDAEIQRMQTLFSRVCSEASPSWRQDADLAFRSRYSPTGKKVSDF